MNCASTSAHQHFVHGHYKEVSAEPCHVLEGFYSSVQVADRALCSWDSSIPFSCHHAGYCYIPELHWNLSFYYKYSAFCKAKLCFYWIIDKLFRFQLLLKPLLTSQEALNLALGTMTDSIEGATWLTPADRSLMRGWIAEDAALQEDIGLVRSAALNLDKQISVFFSGFLEFSRFWRDDLHVGYREFMEKNSDLDECALRVSNFLLSRQSLLNQLLNIYW